jgi:cyclohexadieny/prephenate dehydrogenase / 3-phosphoshikimate 1-carboxyvinyltransferase
MRLVVIGTGLIGGSFALAARSAGLFDGVLGIEPDRARGREAIRRGMVDDVLEEVPGDAEAVLVASPSDTVAPWVVRLAGHRGIVFDTASVKHGVLMQTRAALGSLPPRFVPCHPLAGSDRSGPDAAQPDLFRDRRVVITPGAETDAAAVEQVAAWWRAVGGEVSTMAAERHDEVVAVTSHLPHLLAFSYLQQVSDEHLEHAAGGFRDFTRIGGSTADMWLPIFRLNRAAVLTALDAFGSNLQRARALLEQDDAAGLRSYIEAAADRRRKLADDD